MRTCYSITHFDRVNGAGIVAQTLADSEQCFCERIDVEHELHQPLVLFSGRHHCPFDAHLLHTHLQLLTHVETVSLQEDWVAFVFFLSGTSTVNLNQFMRHQSDLLTSKSTVLEADTLVDRGQAADASVCCARWPA